MDVATRQSVFKRDGDEIRRDKVWDRYDSLPPSVHEGNECNNQSHDTGSERSEGGARDV